ncbi:MAG TPA: ATP-binding protein [Phycisphaerae bacterium]|nr:ATP-binding protein [Phycisphaerae bacterium]
MTLVGALRSFGGSILGDARAGFFSNLLQEYMPRRQCMYNETGLIWLHVVSDALIAAAFYSIAIALVYFVRRRRDIEFNWMLLLFATFIFACGTTHIFGVWNIWQAVYRLDGVLKALTAVVSALTAALLWRLLPHALAVPGPAQLRVANAGLASEINERLAAEEALRNAKSDLEDQVAERTAELAETNRALTTEIQERCRAEEERNRLLSSEQDARNAAEQANRIKDDFLAMLSHELRTPLNAILGWSQILRKESFGGDASQRGLETIERNARVQAQIIEDLMDMSRIVAGKVRLDIQSLDFIPVIEGSIETMRPAIEAKGILLEKALDPAAGDISGDANRLQQVIWNILANAVKFTPANGRIQIVLQRVDSQVELSISDSGQGIKPEFLPYIFDRFRQCDSSSTRRQGGLGLGLSIVKHLIELHGGTIHAKSEGEGKGATFVVTLPVVAARSPQAVDDSAVNPDEDLDVLEQNLLKGVRILAVDDEVDARDLLKRILSQGGAEVVIAGSATEALGILDWHKPDIIISDLAMPGKDGYEFMRTVRSFPLARGGNIPAIALTAFARLEDRVRTLQAGYQMHIAKPVKSTELITVVASLLGRLADDGEKKSGTT